MLTLHDCRQKHIGKNNEKVPIINKLKSLILFELK